jgi:hypothetical protein
MLQRICYLALQRVSGADTLSGWSRTLTPGSKLPASWVRRLGACISPNEAEACEGCNSLCKPFEQGLFSSSEIPRGSPRAAYPLAKLA